MALFGGDGMPTYVRIKRDLIARIQQREWSVGQRIPPEPDLQHRYGGVSRGTVRQALQELEQEGYIRRRQGKGTFVASVAPRFLQYELGQIISFSQQVEQAQGRPTTQLLEKGPVVAAATGRLVQVSFRIGGEEEVYRIRRLRLVDGAPFAVQTVFLLPPRCPDILDQDLSSLFRLYEDKYHVRISQAEQTLRARAPTDEEIRLLELSQGTHVFERERVSYDHNRDPFEVLYSVEAEDKFEYHYQIVEDRSHILVRSVGGPGGR